MENELKKAFKIFEVSEGDFVLVDGGLKTVNFKVLERLYTTAKLKENLRLYKKEGHSNER